MSKVILYSAPKQNYFTGKASLTIHSEYPNRSEARHEMNKLRHIDNGQLYVIWDSNTLVSSTL